MKKSTLVCIYIGILFPFFTLQAGEFPFSFSQIIEKVKVNGNEVEDIGILKNMFDQEENTICEFTELVDGKVTIEVELEYPIILTVYALAAPGMGQEDFQDWKVEYSLDGFEDWKEIPEPENSWETNVSSYGSLLAFRTNASQDAFYKTGEERRTKHYRLTVPGTGKVEISEWQLHGVPCIENGENAFVPDIIQANDNRIMDAEDRVWDLHAIYDGRLDSKLQVYADPVTNASVEYTVGNGETVRAQSFLISTWWDKRGRHPQEIILKGYNGTEYIQLYSIDSGTNSPEGRTLFPSVNGNTATTMIFSIPVELQENYYKYKIEVRSGWEELEIMQWKLYDTPAPVYPDPQGTGTGMDKSAQENSFVRGGEGCMIMEAAQPEVFSVYNLTGLSVISGNLEERTTIIPVPAGIYIVKSGSHCSKVIVK